MPEKHTLIRSMALLVIGAFLGSTFTYLYQRRQAHRTGLEVSAGYHELNTDFVLAQLSSIKSNDLNLAEHKLNYELASCVHFAKSHLGESGIVGDICSRILKITSEQRKNPTYQIEESKVERDSSEPRRIL